MRVLLLGGTTEAGLMARALAAAKIDAIYSYAGRTAAPVAQPLPIRIGGFGGAAGLADYLAREHITHVVDATHPFAATISRNAVAACASVNRPLIALERPPWNEGDGDLWTYASDVAGAATTLPKDPWNVFLAIGRQTLSVFAEKPQHRYLLRLVDPPAEPLCLPQYDLILGRGPFDLDRERALLQDHKVDLIVTKNAGGSASEAKLIAARQLGLPVIMIDRPKLPERRTVSTADQVLHWLDHGTADLGE